MTQKEKAADKRLQRLYGINLYDYGQMLKSRWGGCWICFKKPKDGKRLHVEHDHRVAKGKVKASKLNDGSWYALSEKYAECGYGPTRKEAVDIVRNKLKIRSVRGLVCWQCNTALQKFRDNPDRMESAAKYIRDYRERQGISAEV